MLRKILIGVSAIALFSTTALAQGTPADAKAMLEKTVAAVKADKVKALDQINKGGDFMKGDIYPFCWNISDGMIQAVPNPNAKKFLNTDIRKLTDSTGKVYGPELYAGAQKPEGQITEVAYMFPKTGTDTTPHPKISLVEKVGDMGCGVGYYK
jgi:Single Cache domain 2